MKKNNVPNENDTETSDYDLRGYFKDRVLGGQGEEKKRSDYDGKIHFTDYYKTPYHRTFSNESRYALPNAPHWTDDDKLIDRNGNVIADESVKKGKK